MQGVESTLISKRRWLVRYDANEWLIWPHSGRWANSIAGQQVGELFYGGIPQFIERYIEKTAYYPANHAKAWTAQESECIYEMYDINMSISQMAAELERHPYSMATRISQLLDTDINSLGVGFPLLLDVGLKDLLEAKTLDTE